MSLRVLAILVGCVSMLALPPTASAQFTTSPTDVTATGTSYRVFMRPGEPVIRVHVLGDVGSGLFDIGANTSLTELLALAGGAPLSDMGAETRRTVTVRVYRAEGTQRQLVYESELHQMLQEPEHHPSLTSGDVVTVESQVRQRWTVYRTLQVASSVASLALLALRLSDQFNR